ncbi:ATP-binding protein [Streptomyces sp. NPDC056112]|uniref:ATP-binding protein n=1 Tax=unclassified Streptomyces TaxID=2593676 RepID=UPI001CD7B79F|nr:MULTISPECIES: ATP-binding protein [unclassified Streptomyces]
MPSPVSRELEVPSAAAVIAPWAEGTHGALAAAALRIDCGREGFARARAFTRETLDRWSVGHRADDAAVIVTELAANAATHAVPYAPPGDTAVWLGLAVDGEQLIITVSDPCHGRPIRRTPAGFSLLEHGRGLCIVDALAEEWGWTPRPPAGKSVWVKLSTRPPH